MNVYFDPRVFDITFQFEMQCFKRPARGGDLRLKDLNVTSYLVVSEKASLLGGWRDLRQGSSASASE